MIDLADGLPNEGGGVERNVVNEAGRKTGREAIQEFSHALGGVERVRAGQLVNGDAAGGFAVHFEELAVAARSEFHAAHVADAGDLSAASAIHLEDDLFELRRIGQRRRDIGRELKILAAGRGRHPDLAGGDVGVLLLNRVDHILRGERALVQLLGIEPDAHRVFANAEDDHVADAGQAREFVAQFERPEIAQEERVVTVVLGGERDDLERRGFLLLGHDALLLDGHRQLRHRRRNPVLDEHLRKIQIRPDLKRHRERVASIRRAVGLHVEHLLDAVDLLLDGQGHGLDQNLCARARIRRRHLDGRRRDRWIFGDRQENHRDRA